MLDSRVGIHTTRDPKHAKDQISVKRTSVPVHDSSRVHLLIISSFLFFPSRPLLLMYSWCRSDSSVFVSNFLGAMSTALWTHSTVVEKLTANTRLCRSLLS